eukprot:gene17631-5523_t
MERIPPHVMGFIEAENRIDYLVDMYREQVVKNEKFPKR